MKIEKDEITIRDFTETDLPLMFKWMTDKRVLEYYEGRDVRFTMDTLSAHFLEEIPDGFRMIIVYKKSPLDLTVFLAVQQSSHFLQLEPHLLVVLHDGQVQQAVP